MVERVLLGSPPAARQLTLPNALRSHARACDFDLPTTQHKLVNCTFSGADLSQTNFDSAYLQGADFSGASSVEGANLSNAATSSMEGEWSFAEQNGMPVNYMYNATVLGALATDPNVICPNGDDGPCTGDKLTPLSMGPYSSVPACVPMPPSYDNCTRPAPANGALKREIIFALLWLRRAKRGRGKYDGR